MGLILSADAEGQGGGCHFVICWAEFWILLILIPPWAVPDLSELGDSQVGQSLIAVTSHTGGQDSCIHLSMNLGLMDLCLIRA